MSRRAWRRIGLITGAVIVVSLAMVTVLRARAAGRLERAVARFEEAVGPLDYDAWRPSPVPASQNAGPAILEAIDRMKAIEDLDRSRTVPVTRDDVARLREAMRRPLSSWTEHDVRLAREVVDSSWGRDVLDELREASTRSRSDLGLDYAAGPAMEIPNLLLALKAADLALADARLAWYDGRSADGARAVASLAALSRALETEAPLVFQLVGESVEVSSYRAIQDGLAAPGGLSGAPKAVMETLRDATRRPPRKELLDRALGGEGTMLYELRPGGAAGDEYTASLPWPSRFAYRIFGASVMAGGLDYYARAAEAFPERLEEGVPSPTSWPSRREGGRASQIIPDLGPSLDTFWSTEMMRRLARLALDVEEVGARTGGFPATLPEVSAREHFAGTPPRYELSPDGSAALELAGAEEVARRAQRGRQQGPDAQPLFTWTLAAPEATVATEAPPE